MKALTLHQPYATLIAIGAKQYETRGWSTAYRGPLAIHAGLSKELLKTLAEQCMPYYNRQYGKLEIAHAPDSLLAKHVVKAIRASGRYEHLRWNDFPVGAIVAFAELVDCRPMVEPPPAPECYFGLYGVGRYGWQLANVEFLKKPIPAKGQQGLWTWTA